MLCPGCNKFAAQSADSEPELELEVDEATGSVTGSARIVITSECCDEELKESVFDVEVDLEDAFKACVEAREGDPDVEGSEEDHEFGIVSESAETTERYEQRQIVRKDGTVVPLKTKKHFYGVHLDVEVKCSCSVSATGTYEDEVPAGEMDELV
jgi:hypothetical protein